MVASVTLIIYTHIHIPEINVKIYILDTKVINNCFFLVLAIMTKFDLQNIDLFCQIFHELEICTFRNRHAENKFVVTNK